VATFENGTALAAHRPLQSQQSLTNVGNRRNPARSHRNLRRADEGSDVDPVREDPVRRIQLRFTLEMELRRLRDLDRPFFDERQTFGGEFLEVRVESVMFFHEQIRDRAVKRARIDVDEAESFGETFRRRTLTGTRRTVDGDDRTELRDLEKKVLRHQFFRLFLGFFETFEKNVFRRSSGSSSASA